MHLITDENGNPIPHGSQEHGHCEHTHEHDHAHGHDHPHTHEHGEEGHAHSHSHDCGHCGHEGGCKDETLALLTYMVQHNASHAAETDQMAAKLEAAGMEDVAKQIRTGVAEYQKGNMYLQIALSLYQEHLKEKGCE
ncbi:MAG: cobalt transporter [Eubacteriales bacterium]|nr:cobalt transporter [Eubacteriales bacterium]